MDNTIKIGIFDSGLGGLTVLKEQLSNLKKAKYIYLGDMARTPYGPKGRETIIRYSKECANFLIDKKIDLLIVACNTASSIALEELKNSIPCKIIGTIDPAINSAFSNPQIKKIGIIGTEGTIASGVYQNKIKKHKPEVEIFAAACPLFVPLVEQGMIEGEIVDRIIEHHLASLKNQNIDCLILACTHYPLLANSIKRFFGSSVTIVECSKAIAEETKEIFKDQIQVPAEDNIDFYVTDAVNRFDSLAKLFLQLPNDRKIKGAIKVDL